MTNGSADHGRRWERPFAFAHIGDLHLTDLPTDRSSHVWRRQEALHVDLKRIVGELDSIRTGHLDFIYLPGDIAENGCAGEYEVLETQLRNRGFRVRLIPGDHDRALGTLTDFDEFRGTIDGLPAPQTEDVERVLVNCPPDSVMTFEAIPQFHFHEDYPGVRCIFLDVVSAGYGRKGLGLDFRVGQPQIKWLTGLIDDAQKAGLACAVFMHCYPHDLADPDERVTLAGLFWRGNVKLVEMGHTHYNELAPDGRTLYATARSVGQNEDGPTGYAIAAIDCTPLHGIVTSWRFKQLQLGWPFVIITSPADRRLATGPLALDPEGCIVVRAMVLTDRKHRHARAFCSVDGGPPVAMHSQGLGVFESKVAWPPGSRSITVSAEDGRKFGHDFIDMDTIEPAATDMRPPLRPDTIGTDGQAIGGWPAKGVRGDKPGPNSGWHKW